MARFKESTVDGVAKAKAAAAYAEKMERAKVLGEARQKQANAAFHNWKPDGKVYLIEEQDEGYYHILRQRVKEAEITYYEGQHSSFYRIPGMYGFRNDPEPYADEKILQQSIEPYITYDVIDGDQVAVTASVQGAINTRPLPMRFNIYDDAVAYIKRLTKRPEEKQTYLNANGEFVS